MKSVTHQTTLHLSFKIKCCVDRLRPPGHSGKHLLAAGISHFDPKETLRARAGRAVPARAVHAGREGRGRLNRAWIAFDLAFRLLGIAIFGAVVRRSRLCPATSAFFTTGCWPPLPKASKLSFTHPEAHMATAHVQLKEHLRVLVDPKISEYRGHVVKNTGDGMLAEFSSVVDAMHCAVEVQRGMSERNTGVPQEKRIEFR